MNKDEEKKEAPEEKSSELTRRDFLRSVAVVGGGVALAVGAVTAAKLSAPPKTPTGPETIRTISEMKTVSITDQSDILLRMQDELRGVLSKPVEQRKWLMVIDTRKCVGCHACTIACVVENKLPPGVVYRPVVQEDFGTYPNIQMRFFPRPCMQCESPTCVTVCPVHATWKRPDGIVIVNYERCIGCRYCLSACPYGARTSDYGHYYTENTPEIQQYERLSNNEYGKAWDRKGHSSPKGNARKCHFCLHRLNEGQLPMCVTTCIGRANYFGDANDPYSIVSQMARLPNQVKLLDEKGTKPTVIYLI
jgi:molybdopterin-containing oxidoreductase family iron-sulfur binding subunit